MRIKFLSFIASFLMVQMIVTSCLNNDNDITYTPDATIHAFELDTIYGVSYKFTIDQMTGEIYNEDSLPVHADTLINRILIKTLTTSSGIVSMKTQDGLNDSLFSISDSIDLRKPLKIKVWSLEAYYTGISDLSSGKVREYTIKVNVHKQDPDSMQWAKMATACPIKAEHKSSRVGNSLYVYGGIEACVGVIDAATGRITGWDSEVPALAATPTSLVNFKDILYATVDNKVYSYDPAAATAEWAEVTTLNDRPVKALLAAFSSKLTAVVTDETDGNDYFAQTEDGETWVEESLVPESFSTFHVSAAVYQGTTMEQGIVVGAPASEDDYTVPWMASVNDREWSPMDTSAGTDTAYPSCPYVSNPSIIHYDDSFYIFGGDFSTVHHSLTGIAWYAADSKFWLPASFKDKGGYSLVVDADLFIWVIWNDGEVWRGRLNKLGFDSYKQ